MEGQMSEQSIFQVSNHHLDSAGRPLHLDDTTPNQYRGYFENEHGEQAMFIYDCTTRCGKLYMGDSGWESPYDICDGETVGLNLTPLEQLWLRFVGRQQHGQSTDTVTEIFEQSHLYYEEAQYADYYELCLDGHRRTRASSRYARFLTRQ